MARAIPIAVVSAMILGASSGTAGATEVCGNGLDDDNNGLADEGCYNLGSGQCESPLSCGDTGDVSPKTGSLRYQLPADVSPNVPWGPGIGVRRFYLSQYAPGGSAPAYRTPFGPRWGMTYATWIDDVSAGGSTKVILHTTRGQDILLAKTSSDGTWDSFTPQPGVHYKSFKRRVASPKEYEITLLTGESFLYSEAGRLKEIRDTLATPNKVLLDYDGNGQVSTVTDASGKRRLLFDYSGGVIISIKFQILLDTTPTPTWTDEHTTSYSYTSGNLTGVTIGGDPAQTNTYTSNYLTSIQDHEGNTLVSFAYDGTTAGQIARVDTPRGVVGYEFNSSRSECSGKTAPYFHKQSTTSCSTDTDCGTGYLCGGKTGSGSTGQCFRGARCLTVSSPSEDVITTVSAFAGNSESCEGACLDAIDHVWDTSSGKLDLTAVKDPSNFYTVRTFDGNGLPTQIVYGASDSSGSDPQRTIYLTYGDSNFPGLVTSMRRKRELPGGDACTATSGDCAVTSTTYTDVTGTPVGKPLTVTQSGFTLIDNGDIDDFTYVTTYSYNEVGQIKLINGPLPGDDDLTVFDYWNEGGPLFEGFLKDFSRKTDSSYYLTQSSLDFDFWGNAIELQNTDGSISCQTFDAARGYLKEHRQTMAGQTSCTADASDLVTTYVRDSALRLTKLVRPDGSCMHYEYDGRGRLLRTKRRDDCNASSSGDKQEYTYSAEGLLTKVETFDASNNVTKRQELTYFDSRRLEKIINPVNTAKWTGLAYEPRGLVDTIAAVDGSSNVSKTVWSYNEDGRVASEKRYTTTTSFDTWSLLFSWLGQQVQVTDGDSKVTTSLRDDLGRVVTLGSPDLGGHPTVRIYDEANRLKIVREAFGGSGAQQNHFFTFDNLGRPLVADYAGTCQTWNNPDIVRKYDCLDGETGCNNGAPSCPTGTSCTHLKGRLAYVKVKLMCQDDLDDKTLEQETWYGYDAGGRLTHEYIQDDNGRTAAHVYAWTKNGALQETTLPSTVVLGATFGSSGSNSDTDRITALWRGTTATPIADQILWEPYGPLKQYNQQNTSSSQPMRTVITRNLAYRITKTEVELQSAPSTDLHYVIVDEDAAGRTKKRIYFPSPSSVDDSWFLYDLQNRVTCEATSNPGSSCPTSSTLKNNHSATSPFTAAGDWKTLLRPIPGSSGVIHTFSLTSGTHQIASVAQTDGTPAYGTTGFTYNSLGNRASDDNAGSSTSHDARDYTYDARRNVVNVHGEYYTGSAWHEYDVASAFDAKNRRVFKSFYDNTTEQMATWFFYYDALDRLVEIRHTPDTSASSTYSLFQLVWLGPKLVLYWQTDYPSVTTSKRYVGTDETYRPIDMICWSVSAGANCPRVWTINPDAWGNDTVVVGPDVFQPILFAGQYKDEETTAWLNDGATKHRPALALNGYRTYDSWIGGYAQVDPRVDSTWSTYVYVTSNPVGRADSDGLEANDYVDTWRHQGTFTLDGSWGDCFDISDIEGLSACLDGGNPWGTVPSGGGGGGYPTGSNCTSADRCKPSKACNTAENCYISNTKFLVCDLAENPKFDCVLCEQAKEYCSMVAKQFCSHCTNALDCERCRSSHFDTCMSTEGLAAPNRKGWEACDCRDAGCGVGP